MATIINMIPKYQQYDGLFENLRYILLTLPHTQDELINKVNILTNMKTTTIHITNGVHYNEYDPAHFNIRILTPTTIEHNMLHVYVYYSYGLWRFAGRITE
jgi:hypothetical protein